MPARYFMFEVGADGRAHPLGQVFHDCQSGGHLVAWSTYPFRYEPSGRVLRQAGVACTRCPGFDYYHGHVAPLTTLRLVSAAGNSGGP